MQFLYRIIVKMTSVITVNRFLVGVLK